MDTTVKNLLEGCGTRQQILADVRTVDSSLSARSVGSWHERNSVPGKYWLAIVRGANARGHNVALEDFAAAHSPKEGGQ